MLLEGKYYFMSRPRRFGKSLFLSTLEAYFLGKKELFEGLAVAEWEKDWIEYPVVHIDFNTMDGTDIETVKRTLLWQLSRIAEAYGVVIPEDAPREIGTYFAELVISLHAKTGQQVVVLIDEYDKALIEVLHDEDKLSAATTALRPFFNVLKSCDDKIKFAFITGVSRFRNTTIFSGFNNPSDISLDERYAGLFGLIQDELELHFRDGIEALAEKYEYSYDMMLSVLKDKYDGYRFTDAKIYVYNPFSVLNAMSKRRLEDAWVQSGSSRILQTYLRRSHFTFDEMTSRWVSDSDLQATYSTENPLSLLFQTGYLTIRDYKRDFYRLGIPNQEVQSAIVNLLIPEFVKGTTEVRTIEWNLSEAIETGDVDLMMLTLKGLLASIPYHEIDINMQEKHLHLCMYVIFLMLGVNTKCEIAQAGGRVDMVAQTPWRIYVFEYKIDCSPAEALRQIDEKGYALTWVADGRPITKIGVNFSSALRTIESWESKTE